MRRYTNREIEWDIEDCVHSARDRTILKLIYIDHLSRERVAEIYDMTPRAIDYIIRRYKDTSVLFQ